MKSSMSLLKRCALMQRQMGNISGSLMFFVRGVDGWAKDIEKKAYLAQLETDISDLLTQCKMLASDLDLDSAEVEKLGKSRYEESLANFKAKGKIDFWV